MVNKMVLLRMKDRLSAYIKEFVTLAGTDRREEVFALFDNMQLFFPDWIIMTCPVMHPDIRYVSKNHSFILGHRENFAMNHSPEIYFAYVHEADQEDLHSCFSYVHDFLASTPSEDHCIYRCVFQYRFKKDNGQYILLHDEKAALNLRGAGNLYYALFRDITAEKKFNGVKVEIFKQEGGLEKIKEYRPTADRTSLSKREGELVTLIKQGLSTKEIAWYLNISHHTVRNIKSKLFEKYKVSNTVELLNMTA